MRSDSYNLLGFTPNLIQTEYLLVPSRSTPSSILPRQLGQRALFGRIGHSQWRDFVAAFYHIYAAVVTRISPLTTASALSTICCRSSSCTAFMTNSIWIPRLLLCDTLYMRHVSTTS